MPDENQRSYDDKYVGQKDFTADRTEQMVRLTALEGAYQNVRDQIKNLQTLLDERARALAVDLEKSNVVLLERLEHLNQARQQLDRQAMTFATQSSVQDKIDVIITKIEAQEATMKLALEALKGSGEYNRGRDTTIWKLITVIVTVAAGAIAGLAVLIH